VVVLCLLSVLLAQSIATQLMHQCVNFEPVGTICFNLSNENCYELTGVITANNNVVWGPTQQGVAQVLNAASANSGGPVTSCSSITVPTLGACSACIVWDKVSLAADTLSLCGKLQVNCSSLPSTQTFSLPCVNISGCTNLGCKNGCSNSGTCVQSVGSCACAPTHIGPDCSVVIAGNCIETIATLPVTGSCWTVTVQNCKNFLLTTYGMNQGSKVEYQADIPLNQSVLALTPPNSCLAVPNSPCKICGYVNNITFTGVKLSGCPFFQLECNGAVMAKYPSSCTLLNTLKFPCGVSPPVRDHGTPHSGGMSTTNLLIVVTIAILATGCMIVGGYLLYTKCKESSARTGFARVPTEGDDDDQVADKQQLETDSEEEEDG